MINDIIKIGFIGAGTVATALATSLNIKGFPVTAVSSRSLESARRLARVIKDCKPCSNNQETADNVELVFITTPDDVIAPVASQLKWHTGQYVVHCSGAHSTEIIESARKAGATVGVFHPLQTFAITSQPTDNIPGTTFTIEADEPLLGILKSMATALRGRYIEIKPDDKVIYHTAAVFACNYLVTLVKIATDLWQNFGIPREQAIKALIPILRGTINNIDTIGIPRCLTGPIARGDTGTVSKHLSALQKTTPNLVSTYRELGLKTIPIARAKGKIDDRQAEELEALLIK
ncbi:MAG TPA: DUF2520 domain-containing protein [Dehalococcoidia bacterium]|nr:DUF2520 domain-containing protein [Dehalococcoidia bacterium]